MNKSQQIIKLFVVLLFGTTFIFSFSHYGAKAFDKLTNADGKFSDGTIIGTLDLSGKTKEEAISLIEQKYTNWPKETTIQLQYGETTASIDLSQFHLDANKTINSVKDGQKNKAVITIDKAQIVEQVGILFPQLKSSDLDVDKLTLSLNEMASLFEVGSHTFNIYNDFLLAASKKEAILNSVVIDLDNVPFDLQSLVEKNPTIELQEETTFSLLDLAKKHNMKDSYALDVLATGIYQAVLPSNFNIIERNISSSLPEYALLGFEAKVNQSKNTDLVIANPNKAKYNLELQLTNSQLKVTLKGEKFAYNYKISTKEEQKLKPKVIVQYSPLLLPGKTKVQTKGAEGQIIKVFRDVFEGEAFIKSELISEDYYPATYKVEIHGLGDSVQSQPAVTTNQTTTENSSQTTTPSDSTGNTTTSNGDTTQQESSESDIWGNPNEQPK